MKNIILSSVLALGISGIEPQVLANEPRENLDNPDEVCLALALTDTKKRASTILKLINYDVLNSILKEDEIQEHLKSKAIKLVESEAKIRIRLILDKNPGDIDKINIEFKKLSRKLKERYGIKDDRPLINLLESCD